MAYHRVYIDGALRDADGGRRMSVVCPATERVVAEVAWASASDAQAALDAAQRGFVRWSRTSLSERRRRMLELREAVLTREETLREAVMLEHGKPYEQTEEDFRSLVNSLAFYAEEILRLRGEVLPDPEGTHEHRIVYEPAGVAVAFLAWNFPLLNLAFKLGPALAAGCSLIVRPSTETPVSALLVGEICHEVGLPPGVVNILPGPVQDVAETLSRSQVPALLTLIGSTATGRSIMAAGASSIKRFSMELGGNAPVIVYPDADLELAASTVAALKFGNAGQICVAPNRVLVHEAVASAFVDAVVRRARAVRLGSGRGTGATMGPLINDAARQRVHSWVQEAVRAGAVLHCGGRAPDTPASGFYYEPTVLSSVMDTMRVSCEEVFGPVVGISTFRDEAEAIRRANATSAGLASYLFGQDIDRLTRAARDLRFGEVQVNGVKHNIDLPHGGMGQSGIGHDCSHLALHDYLAVKRITVAIR